MRPLRRLALAAPLLVLAGCNSDGHSTYQEYFQIVGAAWKSSFGSGAVTRQQAAAIPFASMGVRVNGGHENLIVLATQTGDEMLWTSKARIVVVTVNGRIKRTVGLPQDLSITPKGAREWASPAAALLGPFTSQRVVDFPESNEFGVILSCRAAARANQSITILGQRMNLARVDETCRATGRDWSFTDSYWVDRESGFIWRSVQHLHPDGEIVQVTILRPPG